MNLISDDPLADLLSDNENDSFFENYTITPKATIKKPVAASTPRAKEKIILSYNDAVANHNDDDLGFDPKKPKASFKGGKLFDDILGPTKETSARPATAKAITSRESTDTTDTTMTQVRPKTSAGRRGSGHSVITNPDPLGLFTANKKEKEAKATEDERVMTKPKKRGTTADWLGLSVTNEQSIDDGKSKGVREPQPAEESSEKEEHTDAEKLTDEILVRPTKPVHVPESFSLEPRLQTPQTTIHEQNALLMNTINAESQNACKVLQQQELQLTLATQMKLQEQALKEMQEKQESLLQKQDKQFSALLQQQLQRHQHLEEHIKSQQQRITSHIQLLMTQPTWLAPTPQKSEEQEDTETMVVSRLKSLEQNNALETVQLETDVKRLELEKLRLEDLVENLKSNHQKEMDMVESSFRKQLKVLEDHLTAVETRLKNEIEELHTFYGKKLDSLAEEKEKSKSDLETQITVLKQDHDDELRKIRKSQEDDLDMLREEHRRMLDTLRQTKMLEFAVVQENGSYLETLKAASSNLSNVSGDLQTLRNEMQTKIETINLEREQNLNAREKRLEDAERRLQLTEAGAEDEKRRLMELVSSLEVQLGKKTKEAAEENWLLRQQMSTLEAERAALAREKVLMREQFARDEQRIEDLKEQQLAETKRQLLELQDERTRLHVEKTKFETGRKLQSSTDFEKQRLEIEAALQVAQDATRQADAERQRYHHMQREQEQKYRQLVDKEHVLRIKEEEMEQELMAMRMAERKSLEMQQRAQAAEQNCQAKMQFLQQRMRELGETEAQLSHEQLMLAQERIKLQNLKKRLNEQKCALCKISEQNAEIAQMMYEGDTSARGVPSANIRGEGANGETGSITSGGAAEGVAGGDGTCRNVMMNRGNVVDRMLDENIAESYRRMRQTMARPDYWTESVMDDDSKKLALHNLDTDLHLKHRNVIDN